MVCICPWCSSLLPITLFSKIRNMRLKTDSPEEEQSSCYIFSSVFNFLYPTFLCLLLLIIIAYFRSAPFKDNCLWLCWTSVAEVPQNALPSSVSASLSTSLLSLLVQHVCPKTFLQTLRLCVYRCGTTNLYLLLEWPSLRLLCLSAIMLDPHFTKRETNFSHCETLGVGVPKQSINTFNSE